MTDLQHEYQSTYSQLSVLRREGRDGAEAASLRNTLRSLWFAMSPWERRDFLAPACHDSGSEPSGTNGRLCHA